MTVDEAALDTQQDEKDLAASAVTGTDGTASGEETTTGTLVIPGGATFTVQANVATAYGQFSLDKDGNYTYTLTKPFTTDPADNDGPVQPAGASETITYTAVDANGYTVTGTVTVQIKDDAPEAIQDSASVEEGKSVSGNVLTDTNDTFGADGKIASDGGVVGLRASGSETTLTVAPGTDGVIETAFGTLTLRADGSYTYVAKADATTSDTPDVFFYTIKDGDGDLATTTLTINIDNTGSIENDRLAVDEAGLDGIGSKAGTDGEFSATGQITVTGYGGTLTYVLTSPADGDGTYGTLTLNADGSYSYKLDTPYTDAVDENGPNVVSGAESFGYEVFVDGTSIGTGTIAIDNEQLFGLEVDVLVLAALEGQITADNAGGVRARILAEAANGPVLPEADEILAQRGVVVIPDILCNAGGVIVSYFEWAQNRAALAWTLDEVNERLARQILDAANTVRKRAEADGITPRLAAHVIAVERVAAATQLRGLYP